ncbi:NAD(P)-binding domain-containing protein [Pikeienuella piscinae]|uniref:Trimethylamine monooxygenase n=1 Tax=Pikeienuella piscinae TaxID=2748098 RepID=A0A7L5C3P4_9RHOB|nr:NAD(P)-binding domain-containing protein [Pikeienuella piscinae]QIE56489.1 NAD(P)-binding domain-containing protein [Pikeienuella piscinae]
MQDKAAIIGGGPAGLAMGRALKAFGIGFEIIEQNADFGGLWNRDWPLSPVYDSAHFISSRTMSGFDGFPMPEDWPDYPRHDQILAYTRDFARAHGLYEHARFGVAVAAARPTADGWDVETADGERRAYRWLICANGATWDAKTPAIPGAFDGRIRHARDYNSADDLAGRRVLIVGCGNSGADIACDAAQRATHAGLSLRRGYWFIPKHFNGLPTDVYAARQPNVPLWLRQKVLKRRLRKQIGDLARLGLPEPDHELLETHPLMNDQILHHLRHGDVAIYPDIDRLEGREVVFKDGARAAFDEIILATGYDWSAPFLAPDVNPFDGGRAELPLCVFSPERDDLFFISFIKAAGSSITLFGEMAWIIARALRAAAAGGAEHAKLRAEVARNDYDLLKGLRTVASSRHEAYVNRDAYAAALLRLRRRMSWPKTESADA